MFNPFPSIFLQINSREKSSELILMSYPNHLTKFSNEPYRHFMAKSCLFWLLRKLHHEVASEWLVGDGYVDLYDKSTRTLYEIEFQVSAKHFAEKRMQYNISSYEVIIINCSKLPLNINEMKKFLEQFILPD